MTLPSTKKRLLLLGAVCAAVLSLTWLSPITGRQFEPADWASEELIQEGARLQMADDIINRKLLNGKSRSEVIALLGEPPNTQYFRDWHLVYWLGPERGTLSIDSEWLVIKFDKTGRVEKYAIVRD